MLIFFPDLLLDFGLMDLFVHNLFYFVCLTPPLELAGLIKYCFFSVT